MQVKKIKEFAKVRRGASPRPIDDPKYFGGQVGWVRIADVTASRKYLRSTTQYVSKLGESFSVRVNKGDLVISIAGTVGRPIIIDTPSCIHDGFVQIYDFKESDVEFLYYYLQFLEKGLIRYGQSGTQTNLNIDIVSNIKLNCFGKEIESKIASIIGTADKAIEQTEMLIAKYLKIKNGLLQDLLTKGIDDNGNIRERKIHKFILKNGIEVPTEWQVKQVISCTYLKARIGWQGLKASEFTEEGPFLVTGTDIKDGGINWDTCYHVTEERFDEAKYIHLKNGDLIITKDGTIGKTAIVENCPQKAVLNSGVFIMRCKDGSYLNEYMYYILNSVYFKNFLFQSQGGSTINHLYQREFEKFNFPCPNILEQKKIVSILNQADENIQAEFTKLNKLISLKTGLMQDLFSGNVRVET